MLEVSAPFSKRVPMANFVSTDAYSGAILFIAFLSEMRHPMDFWKAMICAQLFISIVYIFFGVFVSHILWSEHASKQR